MDNPSPEQGHNINKIPMKDDAALKELFEWMLDSVSIRDHLKALIANREKIDAAWIEKTLNEIEKGGKT